MTRFLGVQLGRKARFALVGERRAKASPAGVLAGWFGCASQSDERQFWLISHPQILHQRHRRRRRAWLCAC